MTNGRFDRLRGHLVRDCGHFDRMGRVEGTEAETGIRAAFRRLRTEFAEASYWSASVGFGLYAAFRITGFFQ